MNEKSRIEQELERRSTELKKCADELSKVNQTREKLMTIMLKLQGAIEVLQFLQSEEDAKKSPAPCSCTESETIEVKN